LAYVGGNGDRGQAPYHQTHIGERRWDADGWVDGQPQIRKVQLVLHDTIGHRVVGNDVANFLIRTQGCRQHASTNRCLHTHGIVEQPEAGLHLCAQTELEIESGG
jgi:hypothetical protein